MAAPSALLLAHTGDGQRALLCALGIACLPRGYLWWPPKEGLNAKQFDALKDFVQDNLATLVQRHRERPSADAATMQNLFRDS